MFTCTRTTAHACTLSLLSLPSSLSLPRAPSLSLSCRPVGTHLCQERVVERRPGEPTHEAPRLGLVGGNGGGQRLEVALNRRDLEGGLNLGAVPFEPLGRVRHVEREQVTRGESHRQQTPELGHPLVVLKVLVALPGHPSVRIVHRVIDGVALGIAEAKVDRGNPEVVEKRSIVRPSAERADRCRGDGRDGPEVGHCFDHRPDRRRRRRRPKRVARDRRVHVQVHCGLLEVVLVGLGIRRAPDDPKLLGVPRPQNNGAVWSPSGGPRRGEPSGHPEHRCRARVWVGCPENPGVAVVSQQDRGVLPRV
eukprot:m.38422 g.38422  ORF g.38422 m.38422 type:complete len:307 (+) comp7828_c0_seq1:636-1556(+)